MTRVEKMIFIIYAYNFKKIYSNFTKNGINGRARIKLMKSPQKNLDSSYLILRAFVESSSSYAIVVAEALYHRKYWAPASNSRIYIEVKAQTVHIEQNLFQKWQILSFFKMTEVINLLI